MTPAGGINYTNSSISIAAITYKEIHYEDVKRQGLLDGTTWDEYKSQNSADTKMTVDQDMYSLVAMRVILRLLLTKVLFFTIRKAARLRHRMC